MRMTKVLLLVLVGMLCIGILSCASGPKAVSPPVAWDWIVNGDGDNGGTSTIEMADATQDGMPAYKFTGNITNEYEYGFVNVKANPDIPTLEALKTASAISFRVLGDGDRYAVKITTSDIEDYCYYEAVFDTVEGVPQTVIVPVDYFVQPTWGKQVGFMINLENAMFIEFQTTRNGSPGPFEFSLWDLKVWTGGIPTERMISSKPKAAPAPAASKGIGGDLGGFALKLNDNFQYGDGYQGVFGDRRLFNGHKIAPGENYTLKITYTTSRDLEGPVQVGLVDTTPAASYWGALSWDDNIEGSGMAEIPQSKAGETVSATLTFSTLKSATGVSGAANALVFLTKGEGKAGQANSGVQKAVTLTFTEFVFSAD